MPLKNEKRKAKGSAVPVRSSRRRKVSADPGDRGDAVPLGLEGDVPAAEMAAGTASRRSTVRAGNPNILSAPGVAAAGPGPSVPVLPATAAAAPAAGVPQVSVSGVPMDTGGLVAALQAKQAEVERARADAERARAKAELARAEVEARARAEAERARADARADALQAQVNWSAAAAAARPAAAVSSVARQRYGTHRLDASGMAEWMRRFSKEVQAEREIKLDATADERSRLLGPFARDGVVLPVDRRLGGCRMTLLHLDNSVAPCDSTVDELQQTLMRHRLACLVGVSGGGKTHALVEFGRRVPTVYVQVHKMSLEAAAPDTSPTSDWSRFAHVSSHSADVGTDPTESAPELSIQALLLADVAARFGLVFALARKHGTEWSLEQYLYQQQLAGLMDTVMWWAGSLAIYDTDSLCSLIARLSEEIRRLLGQEPVLVVDEAQVLLTILPDRFEYGGKTGSLLSVYIAAVVAFARVPVVFSGTSLSLALVDRVLSQAVSKGSQQPDFLVSELPVLPDGDAVYAFLSSLLDLSGCDRNALAPLLAMLAGRPRLAARAVMLVQELCENRSAPVNKTDVLRRALEFVVTETVELMAEELVRVVERAGLNKNSVLPQLQALLACYQLCGGAVTAIRSTEVDFVHAGVCRLLRPPASATNAAGAAAAGAEPRLCEPIAVQAVRKVLMDAGSDSEPFVAARALFSHVRERGSGDAHKGVLLEGIVAERLLAHAGTPLAKWPIFAGVRGLPAWLRNVRVRSVAFGAPVVRVRRTANATETKAFLADNEASCNAVVHPDNMTGFDVGVQLESVSTGAPANCWVVSGCKLYSKGDKTVADANLHAMDKWEPPVGGRRLRLAVELWPVSAKPPTDPKKPSVDVQGDDVLVVVHTPVMCERFFGKQWPLLRAVMAHVILGTSDVVDEEYAIAVVEAGSGAEPRLRACAAALGVSGQEAMSLQSVVAAIADRVRVRYAAVLSAHTDATGFELPGLFE